MQFALSCFHRDEVFEAKLTSFISKKADLFFVKSAAGDESNEPQLHVRGQDGKWRPLSLILVRSVFWPRAAKPFVVMYVSLSWPRPSCWGGGPYLEALCVCIT